MRVLAPKTAYLLLIIVVILYSYSAFAQWQYSHYDIYPDQMFDCACVDSSTFWAVGSFGYVIKSTDSGRTWSPFSYAHLTDALYEVSFPDPKHGFAASGPTGSTTIIASSDSGETWQIVRSQLPLNWISGLEFADSLNGFVSGTDMIYKTSDGGHNWLEPDTFVVGFAALDIFVINKDTIWACGNTGGDPYLPMIICTINGGITWNIITTLGDTLDGHIISIAFSGVLNGWATVQPTHSYDNYLFKTINGGRSWELIWIAHEGNDSPILKKISALDSLNLKIISDVGNIRSSTDGGYTWNVEFRGYTGLMQAISMYDSTHGLVVGGPISDNTPLLLYYDGAVSIDDNIIKPEAFNLSAYPNPFNSSLSISYSLLSAAQASIDIYNISGQRVASIFDGDIKAGNHEIIWDASGFASGQYFVRLKVGGMARTERITLLK
jgi:photosystem II stability/assembly factor-like uncharacterized protein